MNLDKLNIVTPEGVSELVIREGEAPKQLEPKAPLQLNIGGTIGAVAEFLKKRKDAGQFAQKDCTIYVNRDAVSIELVINERDAYNTGKVTGQLQYHPDFKCLHINERHLWTPTDLAQLLKMHRYWFTDRLAGMSIVTALMNFTADVNQKIEQSVKENGSTKDNFEQIVNSNLPDAITLRLPIFKGSEPQTVEIEFFAKLDGREVSFALLSAGANEALEMIRNTAIDEQLNAIREITPDIAIIEQ